MTKPIFPKWVINGMVGFMLGFWAFIPVHFCLLSRHTKDVEQMVWSNLAIIEQMQIDTLITMEKVLAEYREEIKQMEDFNEYANRSK